MGTLVRKLAHLTPRTSPRRVFSPTRKYVFDTYIFFIAHQILVHCTQRASRARIKRFLCAASPYLCRSASSASRGLPLPLTTVHPSSGFVMRLLPLEVLNKIGGWSRNQRTLKACQQQSRGPLDQPILRREVILRMLLMHRTCFALLLSTFVADLFQSSVRGLVIRYLPHVIPVHICYDYWNDIVTSSFPSSRRYALSQIFVATHTHIFAEHDRGTQKPIDETLTKCLIEMVSLPIDSSPHLPHRRRSSS
jgi:hypothetical protein